MRRNVLEYGPYSPAILSLGWASRWEGSMCEAGGKESAGESPEPLLLAGKKVNEGHK